MRALPLRLLLSLSLLLLPTGLGLFVPTPASASVPQIIHYQGRLYDNTGTLLGGSGTTYCFKYSIYDDATVGAPDNQLWPAGAPTAVQLSVQYGVFNYDLGDTVANPTDGDLTSLNFQTSGSNLYLQTEVATFSGTCGTFQTLSPRQRIVSQGNVINANALQGATPGTGNSNVLKLNGTGGIDLTGTTAAISAAGAASLTLQSGSTGNINFFNSTYGITNSGALTIGSITGSGALTIAAGGAGAQDLTLNASGSGNLVLGASNTNLVEFFNSSNTVSSSGNLTLVGGVTAQTTTLSSSVSGTGGSVASITQTNTAAASGNRTALILSTLGTTIGKDFLIYSTPFQVDFNGLITTPSVNNSSVATSAGIAYSKLNLTGSVAGGDLASNIAISTTGNVTTTGSGTITSAGLLTASNGFTLTTGTLTLPSASISDSALSSNVPLKNGANTFTANNVIQSGTGGLVGLTVKGKPSDTANTIEVFDSAVTPARQAFFDSTGALTLAKSLTASGGLTITCTGCVTDTNVADALTLSGGTVNNTIIGGSTPAAGTFTTVAINNADGLTLGNSTNGGIVFKNGSNSNTVTVSSGGTTTSYSLVLPLAQASGIQFLQNDGSGNLSWATSSGGCPTCVQLTPGTTAANTIQPTAAGVIGLTIKGSSTSNAKVLDIFDSTVTTPVEQAFFDSAGALTVNKQITSTVSTGTAPFSVASTTNVANLNASSLNGATFAAPGTIGGGTPGAGTFTALTVNTSITLPSASISDSALSSNIPLKNAANTFTNAQTIAPTQAGVVALTVKGTTNASTGNVLEIFDSTATPTRQSYFDNTGALNTTKQIVSTISTGTSPFSVASTTVVSNLNAALLNGSTFAAPGSIGSGTPGSGAFTTISASGQITSTVSTGTAPLVIASTTNVANLNASSLNGATFAAPGAIGGTTPGAGTFTTLTSQTSHTFGTTAASGLLQAAINNTVTNGDIAFTMNHTGTTFADANDLLLSLQEGGSPKLTVTKDGNVSANQFTSTVSTGTAPFVVSSTTNVANLNASSLNGATFAAPGSIGSGTPGSGAFTTVSASGQFTSTVSTGTAPLVIASTTNVANLNASSLNGATFAAPGAIGGTTPGSATFTSLTAQTSISLTNNTDTNNILAVTNTGLATGGNNLVNFTFKNSPAGTAQIINGVTVTEQAAGNAGSTSNLVNLTAAAGGTVNGLFFGSNLTNYFTNSGGTTQLTSGGTLTLAGTIAANTTNTINGVSINSGAVSGVSTISMSGQLTSTLATGTAPFSVASTTNVANLNASSLSGATFAAPGTIGGTTPGAATFTTLTANTSIGTGGNISLTGASPTISSSNASTLTISSASNQNIAISPGGTGSITSTLANLTGSGLSLTNTSLTTGNLAGLTFKNNSGAAAGNTASGLTISQTPATNTGNTSDLVNLSASGAAVGTVNGIEFTGTLGNLTNFIKAGTTFVVDSSGNVTAGTYNTDTLSGSALTFGTNGANTVNANANNTLTLNSSSSGNIGFFNVANNFITSSGALTIAAGYTGTSATLTGATPTLTLGTAGASGNTGGIVFKNSTNANTVTINSGATSPSSYTLVLPIAQSSGTQFLQNDGSGNLSWASSAGGCAACVQLIPSSTPANTIQPTASGVIGLTIKGSTTANAKTLDIFDSAASPAEQAFFDSTGALTVNKQITSSVTTGTAPFSVASTTNVANLNASSLNGATFAAPGSIGSGTPGSGAFTTISASSQITSTVSTGTAPLVIASTTNVANLNASSLNGATFAAPGTIGGTTPGAATFTTLTANTSISLTNNSDTDRIFQVNNNALATTGNQLAYLSFKNNNGAGSSTINGLTIAEAAANAGGTNTSNLINLTAAAGGTINGVFFGSNLTNFFTNSGGTTQLTSGGTLTLAGTISANATNTINGVSISSGAVSGVSTISMSGQLTSTLATGTAPFSVASTTNVANLNASSLNGATFAAPGTIGGGTPGAGTFTTLTANTSISSGGNITLTGASPTISSSNASTLTISSASNQNIALSPGGTGSITTTFANLTGSGRSLTNTSLTTGNVEGITFQNASGAAAGNTASGLNISQTPAANTGNTSDLVNLSASGAAVGTVNGIEFTGTLGNLTNLIKAGTAFVVTSGGAITAATSSTINGISINSGAVSGVSTLGLSGAITGATSTNTINNLVINNGALSNISTINMSGQLTSTLATGTAPFSVASTTNVANLNASSLNGATFAAPGAIGGTTPGAGTFTALTVNQNVTTNDLIAFTNTGLTTTGNDLANFTFKNNNGAGSSTINGLTITEQAANVGGTNTSNNLNLVAAANGTINGIFFGSNFTNYFTNSGGTTQLTSGGTLTLAGTIAANTTNTINGVSISSGAVSGVSTIGMSGQLTSTLATGTAPFSVASTTNVANLNASSLSGATFSAPGTIGGGTPGAATFTTANVNNSNGLTLGQTTGSNVGGIVFNDGANANSVTIKAGATSPAAYTLILPLAQASGTQFLSNDGSGNLSWATGGGGCGTCVWQTPGSTGQNTIQPTAAGVIGLTIKGSSTSNAKVLDIFDSTVTTPVEQAFFASTGALTLNQTLTSAAISASGNITLTGTSPTISSTDPSSLKIAAATDRYFDLSIPGQGTLVIERDATIDAFAGWLNLQSTRFSATLTGNLANDFVNTFQAPTFTAASTTKTITTAATVYIDGAPAVSGTAAITNNYSLLVAGGTAGLGTLGSINGSLSFNSSNAANVASNFTSSASQAANINYILPATIGSSGNVLTTTVSGTTATLSWTAPSGGCSTCIWQVPGTIGQNTIQPTASGVIGLTIKGSTTANAKTLDIFDSAASPAEQLFVDATGVLTVNKPITAPTTTNTINGLIVNSGALSGITTLTQSSSSDANAISLTDNALATTGNALATLNYTQAAGAAAGSTVSGLEILAGTSTNTGNTSDLINLSSAGATSTVNGIEFTGTLANFTNLIKAGTNLVVTGAGAVTAGTYNTSTLNATTLNLAGTNDTISNTAGTLAITPAGALTVGATGQTTTIQGSTMTENAASGNYSIQVGGAAFILLTQATGALGINSLSTGALTVQSLNQSAGSTSSGAVKFVSGNAAGATSNSGNLDIDVGTATGTVGTLAIGNTNGNITRIINIGTAATTASQTIKIGATTTTNLSKLYLLGSSIGTVTGTTGVIVGSDVTDANAVQFQLDSYNAFANVASSCSTTVNQGAMYYNSNSGAVRICLNGAWEDMATTAALGLQLFGVVPDTGANPGDIFSVTGAQNGPCKPSVGAATTTVTWTACTAFSGGRKTLVTAGSLAVTTTNGNFQHLCISATTGQPTLSTSGTEVANLATSSFPSVTAPNVCLADIKTSASAISAVYDTRTFTTTNKTFAAVAVQGSTAPALGFLVQYTATKGALISSPAVANSNNLAGVIVATNGTSSSTAINSVVAIGGPAMVKGVTGGNTVGNYIFSSATIGYATTVATKPTESTATIYNLIGNARNAWSGATACTANTDNCQGSLWTEIDKR